MTHQGAQAAAYSQRRSRLRQAFFHGQSLHLGNHEYLRIARTLLNELLGSDVGLGDLTATALQLSEQHASAKILAKESGVVAGIAEFCWLLNRDDLEVKLWKQDGDTIKAGDVLLEVEGRRGDLLAHERVGLNLLQRLSGIATATRRFQEVLHRHNPDADVVATRKTPWGLLDKRAVHLGGGGTHRLGLWDAVLVKNNHLAPLADREEDAVKIAVERAWPARKSAAFIEIEVRSEQAALAAAEAFRRRQESPASEEDGNCPCALLLDNMPPSQIAAIIGKLRAQNLLDHVLIEASGNISEQNLEEYATSGGDAISMGALTHSARALDLCERL